LLSPPFIRAGFSSPMLPAGDPGLYEMVYEPASFETQNRTPNLISFKWYLSANRNRYLHDNIRY